MSNATTDRRPTSIGVAVGVAIVSVIGCVAALIGVAGLTGQGTTTVTISAPDTSFQARKLLPLTGGNLTWAAPREATSQVRPKDTMISEIQVSNDVITLDVQDKVTYVDMQLPAELHQQGLVGIIAGADYVPLPDFLFAVDVSTVELGDQFPNRQHVYAVWRIEK